MDILVDENKSLINYRRPKFNDDTAIDKTFPFYTIFNQQTTNK